MDDSSLHNNANFLMQSGFASQKELNDFHFQGVISGNINMDQQILNDHPNSPKSRGINIPISTGLDDGNGNVSMTAVPFGALTSGKLGLPLGDLDNVTLFNTSDGQALELQAFPGGSQALQGIQTVKLTLINCGDQQTILLTTPSTQLCGNDSGDGVALSLPDNLFGGDINLSTLTNPMNQVSINNHMENDCAGTSKMVSYANLTSLPPITSVSDRLYQNQQNMNDQINLAELQHQQQQHQQQQQQQQLQHSNYAIQDLKPVLHRNGEKLNGTLNNGDKSLPELAMHGMAQSNQVFNNSIPTSITLQNDGIPINVAFSQNNELKAMKNLDMGDLDNVPLSPAGSVTDEDRMERSGSPPCELEELNTKDLAQKISGELKRFSIPQAVFAQRVLCRSQGTLSDLLRNPKPWSKLKSGRETFRRMWKWLNEPEFQRMSSLRIASGLAQTTDTVTTQRNTIENISIH